MQKLHVKLLYLCQSKTAVFKPESQPWLKLYDCGIVQVLTEGPASHIIPNCPIAIDEYSCFLFVFHMSSTTMQCFLFFCLFCFPGCMQNNRDAPFVCRETSAM